MVISLTPPTYLVAEPASGFRCSEIGPRRITEEKNVRSPENQPQREISVRGCVLPLTLAHTTSFAVLGCRIA